jgi:hypothetical protein
MAALSGVSNDRRQISLFDSPAYTGSKSDGCFSFTYELPKEHADVETSSSSLRPSVCLSISLPLPTLAHWKLHFAYRRIQIYTRTVYSSWSTEAKIGAGDILTLSVPS